LFQNDDVNQYFKELLMATNPESLIRLAGLRDLQRIDEIYNQAIALRATAHLAPLTEDERLDWFKKHEPVRYPVFVAEYYGQVAGWLSLSPYRYDRPALRSTAEISYYVHENFRCCGIGTQLIKHAVLKAPELNFRVQFAIILEHNTASIRLLEKCNFEKWGFLPEVAIFDGEPCGQYYYGMLIRKS